MFGVRTGTTRYFFFGVIGVSIAQLVCAFLAWRTGVSFTTWLIVGITPMAAFLIAVKASQIVFGYERIVFYEKSAAALAFTAAVLYLAGEPVLPGLDIYAIGILTFLVFGRVGCFTAACCHGRPAQLGIAYGRPYADRGLPKDYTDIPLFPIQLFASVLVLLLLIATIFHYLANPAAGEVAAFAIASYGILRFILEFFRGDDDRPVWLGVTESQWIALVSVGLVGHWKPFIAMALVTALLIVFRRPLAFTPWGLASPAHLHSLREAIATFSTTKTDQVQVLNTNIGLILSFSEQQHGDELVRNFAVSRQNGILSVQAATIIGEQIQRMVGGDSPLALRPGPPGLFHIRLEEKCA